MALDQEPVPVPGTGSLLSWYDSSRPMFIDLVGDYAGKELFLLEGDSLLREAFEDDRIDFQCKSDALRSLQHSFNALPCNRFGLPCSQPKIQRYCLWMICVRHVTNILALITPAAFSLLWALFANNLSWFPVAPCCLCRGKVSRELSETPLFIPHCLF
jgi:hypothetical protein